MDLAGTPASARGRSRERARRIPPAATRARRRRRSAPGRRGRFRRDRCRPGCRSRRARGTKPGRQLVSISSNRVAEPQHDIGLAEQPPGQRIAMSAEAADRKRMIVADRAAAGEAGQHGNRKALRQGDDLFARVRGDRAAAGHEDRPLRAEQRLRRRRVCAQPRGADARAGPRADRSRPAVFPMRRSRGISTSTGPGLPLRATANAWRKARPSRSARSTRIAHLVTGANMRSVGTSWLAPRSAVAAAAAPADETIGQRADESFGDACEKVGDAGPRRDEADAGLAGQLRIARGHAGRRLLVPHQIGADVGHIVQRVVNAENMPARNAEQTFDAFRPEDFRDDPPGFDLAQNRPPIGAHPGARAHRFNSAPSAQATIAATL